MPQFEAAGAQVVGVSADHVSTLDGWTKQNKVSYTLVSDFRRTMLPTYDALETNEKSPIFRYAKRAYFIVDRQGVLRYMKVQQNPLELLKPEEVVQALKDSGAK